MGGRLIFRIRGRIKHFLQGVLAWLQVTPGFLEAPTQPPTPAFFRGEHSLEGLGKDREWS